MISTITLTNGQKYNVRIFGNSFRIENEPYKNITSLLKAIKLLVYNACAHDVNTYHSFKLAQKQKCHKCRQFIINN